MGKRTFLVVLGLWLIMLTSPAHGQLSTADKQTLLNLHNRLRGSVGGANMLQSVWDPELATTAQQYAERCHSAPNPSVTTATGVRRGENLGYAQGQVSLLAGAESSMQAWLNDPQSPSYTQAVWWNVIAIGCGAFQCPRLSLAGGGRVDDTSFLVCYYLTVYIAGMPPFTPGEQCTSCPSGYPACDTNGLCATSVSQPVVPDDTTPPPTITRRVTGVTPGSGSIGGGSRISIRGTGFSGDQQTGINEVYLRSGDIVVPCDVQNYYTTTNQIVCDTRPSPNGEARAWSMIVRVRDGEGAEWEEVDTPCNTCFQQRNNWTPWLEALEPYAGEPSSLITISGRIFTIAFDDTPEDPPLDVITRVTVGNRLCNHVNEDGNLYGAVMTSNIRGRVTCLTDTSNIIDSMNVSLTLDLRGGSFIRLSEHIIGIDNQLRPYSYQTYAEILSVLPDRGSVEGGTTITITTSVDLRSYREDEVQVYVGGQECEDVSLTGNGSIQCTTPSQPPALPYYPGGRGLLREVWKMNIGNLDYWLTQPLSSFNSIQERAYRELDDPREFGEREYFAQRYSAFFVPPVTSLYTFAIISDDNSRLYISPTANAEDMELVAYAVQNSRRQWDWFDSQTSEPMMMERGHYYYMEAYSYQGPGYWNLGISAKIHSVPYTTYPYQGDREMQRIMTTSSILEEIHAISLTVSPSVYDIDIIYTNQEEGDCDITITIGDSSLTLSPDTMTSDLEAMFNQLQVVQEVGGVTVERSEGQYEDGYNRALLRLVFLTATIENLPMIGVSSSPDNCSNITSGLIQQLTTPTFQLGFPDSPRQTRPLSVTMTTAEDLQAELETLLSYECTRNGPPNVLVATGYEEETEGTGGVVRSRAYCGRQSVQSPSTIWERNNPYQTTVYPQVCFAYLGTLPAMWARVHYYAGDGRVGTDITLDIRANCPEWPTSFDGAWHHLCINLHTCLLGYDPEGQMFQVNKIWFSSGSFWIDEFTISSGRVEVSQTAVPITPGGVQISAVTVTGGYITPTLLEEEEEEAGNDSLSMNFTLGPIPRLAVSTFQISYTVVDCGAGMTLIQGDQSDSSNVINERLQTGTPGVAGTFDLSFNGREIRGIPADISSDTLEEVLETNFPNEGGFTVRPGGGCEGRWWDISWETREGDIPSMTADGTGLVGSDPMVSVVTMIDGGMWLRPLRGDMLRLPEPSPQVEVIINSIPSSCRSKNCSFNYSTEATPLVESLSPLSGQQGTSITLYGSGFQGDEEGVRVWLGGVECVVTSANESEIICTVGAHSAGQVRVTVHIPGRGYAAVNDSVCFTYLLSLSGVQPNRGSTEGGTQVTISGHGFLTLTPIDALFIGSPLDSSAWLAAGFGWPQLPPLHTLCPSLAYQLMNISDLRLSEYLPLQQLLLDNYSDRENRTRADVSRREELQSMITSLYLDLPVSVFIGSAPCVISSASIDQLNCITTSHYDSTVNITVRVLEEVAVLENGYTYDENLTPTVTSISPTSGPVYGGTPLIISGEALASTTSVMIGDAPCEISSRNATAVECITTGHAPMRLPIILTTDQGVARVAMEGSGEDLVPRETPFFFTYQLEVNSLEPRAGSVNGGQQLTITGQGFHPAGLTSILIGGRHSYIVSASDTEVTFITPAPFTTHTITFIDEGFSIDGGFQFAWSTPNIVVQRGDRVTWEWDVEFPGVVVNVFQTPQPGSSMRLEGGFASGDASTSGSFTWTFREPGVFYYASELNQLLVVYGQVTVEEAESLGAGIVVLVDGYEAPFVPLETGSGGMLMPEGPGGIQRRQAEGCENGQPVEDNGFSFVYDVCSTPTVTSVTPQSGNALTIFTLMGSLLLPPLASDTVMVRFGPYSCIVMSVNNSVIECRLDLMQMPPSFTPLELSVDIPGLGSATTSLPQTTIELSPIITALSPANSSTKGGSHLFISGHGFPSGELSVTVGDESCEIVSQSYSSVQCLMAGGSSGSFLVQMARATDPQYPFECVAENSCMVAYSLDHTPMVENVMPASLVGPGDITIEIGGTLFSEIPQDNVVMVGGEECSVTSANSSFIQCSIPALPAGNYPLYLTVCPPSPTLGSYCPGRAVVMSEPLSSPAEITDVTPRQGSVAGGTQLAISGLGFSTNPSEVSVSIGGQTCTVTSSSYNQIMCTTAANAAGTYDVMVTSLGIQYPPTQNYTYSMEMTPMVMSISPSNGQQGTSVTISGANLGGSTSVDIGGSECTVDTEASSDTDIMCSLGLNLAGEHNINVNVDGVGSAMVNEDLMFNYDLLLTTFSPTSGSMAGMSSIMVGGMGFNPTDISATVCGEECSLSTSPGSLSAFECVLPPMTSSDGGTINCPVAVQSLGITAQFAEMFTYSEDLTPIVERINRTRGGTQGGSRILIEGSGFDGGSVSVTIADVPCEVMSSTENEIVCDTGVSGRTIRAQVMVFVEGKGFAESENIVFWYVDLWSSRFTWGNQDPPREGEFVVVQTGQTLVLDVTTPILSYLLVQGGELIFDEDAEDDQVGLHTHGMLITEGGKLVVGTEDKPFEARTEIVLYGDVLSTEIPVYGAKTLALRQGSIDIHGKPLMKTWTRLSETASAGSSVLKLQEAVDWAPGGKIVIASTSFSQRENEELTIAAVIDDGMTLMLTSPLEYEHISVKQTIAGREIDTSAEVGYLTRNVVVRGSVNEEFVSEVDACPEEFRTGQFQLQTCFLGRFGSETLSDQFGSQIMIHAPEQNRGDVFGRFSYIEVTHAGQAFRLGRYPIHFHLNGDVTGSYVRGCSIHHTFNRAVTVHAVDHLLVENNVAYNILGHAYFLEDGIEENNIIQDNLGIFVRASSSLLNVDITPAVYWIVNPNNIVRRNAAAGGTHFGFWYRLPVNPTGPSFTASVTPRRIPLGEFTDNSAHSFGWYGLWVFPAYNPTTPAMFQNFLSWRNERGVEFSIDSGSMGPMQLLNSTLMDNLLAGFETTQIESEWGESLVKDTLIVGHSEISTADESFCTVAGIKTPRSPYLIVESVTFVNFDRQGCTAIAACSHCKNLQGGFETRYRDITFINSPRVTAWQWKHEHYHRDLDGTLTGTGQPCLLVPSSELLPPVCMNHTSSFGALGSICPGSVEFARFALFNPTPRDFLRFDDIHLTNSYGTTVVEYEDKRLLVGTGHMALLPVNQSYALDWNVGVTFTNITYQLRVTQLDEENYIFLQQEYPEPLDSITINGKITNVSESFVNNPSEAETGDWFSDDNNTINYIITGDEDGDVAVNFQTYTCFYENCIPPPPATLPPPIPPGRPEVTQSWSDPTIWPEGQLPQEGQDVFINCSWYLLLDTTIPRLGRLTICGALEVLDGMEHTIEAEVILITGGRLVAGYPDTPFVDKVTFLLHGNRSSREVSFDIGPILGSKAIGVFGELILTSEPRTPTWTRLAATVEAGGTEIVLSERVEWEVGDEIVITSTSFEGAESEKAVIAEVSNSRMRLTLSSPLQYQHVHVTETVGSRTYTLAAEVGLLTRNIKISNANSQQSDQETFGCRVLAGTIQEGGEIFTGTVQMQGVELSGCGQLGLTEQFDPRFAVAALNIIGRGSYIRGSSVHDGYNTGIGVFGSDGFQLTHNVIHNTVGSSVRADGSHLVITDNLASWSQFLATYRDEPDAEPANFLWPANFDLSSTRSNLTLRRNVAAGGNKAGFYVNGDACTVEGEQLQVADNTAHSTLHGIHLGYSDGHPSGCTHIARFTAHSCHHYGIFSFSPAELRVSGATLINNNAGIFAAVIGPPSLSHRLGNKEVIIEDSLLVSATPDLDCTRDSVTPRTSLHPQAFSNLRLRSPSNGHVGIIIPVFTSGPGHRTLSGWSSISAYPAISGKTTIRRVTFANFGSRCPERTDTLLTTHPRSEDCNHPTHLQEISHHMNSDAMKYFNHEPILGSINPSDCVDLDCDGLKHVLVRDEDGSFLETGSPRSLISMAELSWGDNGPRGLGNFRIPTVMLATPGGGMQDADTLFPTKGIARGNGDHGDESQCIWNSDWNSYVCENIEHLMIVIESLDDDTEVRRLSPVGLAANGFIDILNGPMDNGWCGGYTCQERISTFFGIVASGLSYTMALTSTNPQSMALHLLNAEEDQAILIAIFYTSPQRLDVYYDDQYVVPNNAMMLENGNLEYQSGTVEDFMPTMDQAHGSNYYDRDSKQLHILLRGDRPYVIRTTPVIQVGLSLEVSVDDFFSPDRLVQNLAFLLGIDSSQIRLVSVVTETISKRRRRQDGGTDPQRMQVDVEFEIGNPPVIVTMDTTNMTSSDNKTMTNDTTTEAPPTDSTLSFDKLEDLTEMVVDVIQTGQLTSELNATVVNAVVMEPEPEPVDPTNGNRATPSTGGPQPGENGTEVLETFSDMQFRMEMEEQNQTVPVVFTIPTQLSIERSFRAMETEGIPLPLPPILVMFDNFNNIIQNLGLDEAWRVRANVESSPQGAFLANDTAELVSGRAEFSGLAFSYPGTYQISFEVVFPESAEFRVVVEEEIVVLPRDLQLVVASQPSNGNTTHPLFPPPVVELWEDGALLREHDWRNSTWWVRATLMQGEQSLESWVQQINSGYAEFTEIAYGDPGQFTLVFEVFTEPSSLHVPATTTSNSFYITRHPLTRLLITYDEDYDSIIGENDKLLQQFITTFTTAFLETFPSQTVEIYNITAARGSIVVSVFLTSRSARDLLNYVETVIAANDTFNFMFQGVNLVPLITQDPAYPVSLPEEEEDELTLILVTIIPSGTVLLTTLLIILFVTLCYRHRKNTQSFKPHTQLGATNTASMEKYVQHNMGATGFDGSEEERYLTFETEKRLEATTSTLSFQSFEMKEKDKNGSTISKHDSVVVSKVISVPGGSVFVNPSPEKEQEEVGRYVTMKNGKPTAASIEGGIGGLEKEVEEMLTKSGSLVEAESHIH